jgi:hypothetical protein
VHVGGRTADLRWHEPTLDRLLEVHSTHATSDWFLLDALKRGYRMGVIAGSDGVDGRPGASHPGTHGRAQRARWADGRCDAEPDASRAVGRAKGSSLLRDDRARACSSPSPPATRRWATRVALPQSARFEVHVEGTAPIETIEFFRDDACIERVDPMASGERSRLVRVAWSGPARRATGSARAWTGTARCASRARRSLRRTRGRSTRPTKACAEVGRPARGVAIHHGGRLGRGRPGARGSRGSGA